MLLCVLVFCVVKVMYSLPVFVLFAMCIRSTSNLAAEIRNYVNSPGEPGEPGSPEARGARKARSPKPEEPAYIARYIATD
ncbi:hypothetical protein BZA77DRAFT_307563 [Pyronema omphalodes]|nr:hypothetical protein BZA77DRAFT_307563 [Pyronema omphalodes]